MTFPIFSPEFIREICVAMTTWTFRMFGICMNLNNFFSFLGTGIKPERERERGRKRTKYSGALGAHLVRYWNEHSLRQRSPSFASPPWNRIFTPRPPPRRPLSSEYEIIRLPRFPEFLEYFQKIWIWRQFFFPKKFPKKSGKIAKNPQSNFPLDNLNFH